MATRPSSLTIHSRSMQFQTFRQTVWGDIYTPVSREMVACALERIAADLRSPACPNPENSPSFGIDPNRRFVIHGECHMAELPEIFRVTLHQQL